MQAPANPPAQQDQTVPGQALGIASDSSQATPKGKVAVIGAGPAGLSCALELLKAGYAVDIFELDERVGGLARTVEVLGQKADLGSHRFFSKLDEVNNFWHQGMSADDFIVEQRLSRILYNGKFFDYPLKGFDALFKLGLVESTRCVLSYAYAALFPRQEPTFEAWVSNAFGKRLYEIFFKTYSERLWGIKCSELSDQFAKQRIKTLNLSKAILNAVLPQRNKDGKPLTLIDEFVYPRLGCGMVYERVAQEIERRGGRFFFKQQVVGLTTAPVTAADKTAHPAADIAVDTAADIAVDAAADTAVDTAADTAVDAAADTAVDAAADTAVDAAADTAVTWANNGVMGAPHSFPLKITGIVTQELASGQGNGMSNTEVAAAPGTTPQTRAYDIVVSSGIFREMVRSLTVLPDKVRALCSQLRFRNTIMVYLTVDPDKAKLCPDHWIYVHSPEIKMGRMTDFANWSHDMQQGQREHLLGFEYWANDDEELWRQSDAALMAQARADAVKTGFITAAAITGAAVHRIHMSYPVYFNGYESVLAAITRELDKVANLYFIGRNGSYKYNNMDHSVLMGLFCAQKIAGQYHGSLWAINTDSDYQEIKAQA